MSHDYFSRERFAFALALCVALSYACFGTLNVHKHGVTVDASSLFRVADRTLFWLQHGMVPELLDMNGPEPRDLDTQFGYCPDPNDRFHYPIFPAFIGSLTSYVVHDKLDWMDRVDAHHLGLVILNTMALFFFAIYSCRFLGRIAGTFATLSLLFFPLALGHSFNNPKDWPCAQFYGLSILACGHGVAAQKTKHLWAGAIFAGIALSSKLNGAFALATLGVWTPFAYLLLYFRQRRLRVSFFLTYASVPFVAVLVFFVCWPWLYQGSPRDWYEHVREYIRFMAHYGVGERDGWTAYPFRIVMWMTPLPLLAAALVGAACGWKRFDRKHFAKYLLVMLWILVPLVRIAVPRSNFYDLNRHFIEYVPALAALAGMGIAKLFALARGFVGGTRAYALLGSVSAAYLLGLVLPVANTYPFEVMYYNSLAGGLGGAQARGLSRVTDMSDGRVPGCEGDYWFSTTRLAYEAAIAHGATDDSLAVCGPGLDMIQAWGRDLISQRMVTADSAASFNARHMIIIPREGACCWSAVRQFERERRIVHREERDGGLVFEVLGPYEGQRYEPTTPENVYSRVASCGALENRPRPPSMRRTR